MDSSTRRATSPEGRQICLTITPDDGDLALASELVAGHDLTLYDAAYAAVARRRDAPLVTLDQRLLDPGLGVHPDQLLAQLRAAGFGTDRRRRADHRAPASDPHI